MRTSILTGLLLLLAGTAAAQEPDHVIATLRARLPEQAVEPVVAIVQDALGRGLPGQVIADLAVMGAARGRDAEAIVDAAGRLAALLAVARTALGVAGRSPSGAEIRAAATALQNGADAAAVRGIAAGAREPGSIEIPLTMLGGLAARGLPVDRALEAIRSGRPGRGPGAGGPPGGLPIGGITLPVALPPGIPVNIGKPGDRPVPPGGPPFTPPGGRN